MPIHFFSEEIDFTVRNPRKIKEWIKSSAKKEKKDLLEINFIFCSDKYLLAINKSYLNHNTLTDIITFDYSDNDLLSGDIYISVERILENAEKYKVEFEEELRRVLIHGVLHLSGYKDKKSSDVLVMRKKEGAYLSLWGKLFHVKP